MIVFHSDEPILIDIKGKSIFLAGPSPRSSEIPSWRPKALEILEKLGFEGMVLVPERRDWSVKFAYEDQVEWERYGLNNCQTLVFWVPRENPGMLGLTTNVEFGYWLAKRPASVIYGRPEGAVQTRYLDWLYQKETKGFPDITLEELLERAANDC